jgi:hypothetical protein
MAKTPVQPYLDLADWRRRVGDLYRISGPTPSRDSATLVMSCSARILSLH